jgi:hypothetical protein
MNYPYGQGLSHRSYYNLCRLAIEYSQPQNQFTKLWEVMNRAKPPTIF